GSDRAPERAAAVSRQRARDRRALRARDVSRRWHDARRAGAERRPQARRRAGRPGAADPRTLKSFGGAQRKTARATGRKRSFGGGAGEISGGQSRGAQKPDRLGEHRERRSLQQTDLAIVGLDEALGAEARQHAA